MKPIVTRQTGQFCVNCGQKVRNSKNLSFVGKNHGHTCPTVKVSKVSYTHTR